MGENDIKINVNFFILYDLSHLLHTQKDFPYGKFPYLVADERYTLPKNTNKI